MPALTRASPVKTLRIPETLRNWPWQRQINPHYKEVSAQSNAWFRSFKASGKRSQRAFDKSDFGRLAALAYPWSSKEHLRTGCDLMGVLFVIDEYTDVEDASTVREIVDIVMDALNNPHKTRPEGEIILGEITRQFWELAIKTATPSSQRHFIDCFATFLDTVVDEAAARDNNTTFTIDGYLHARREHISARPFFVPIELGLDLPDEVFYHPVIAELCDYVAEILFIDHDVFSYNKEQAFGVEGYNILTVVMHELNTDLDGAVAWVTQYHAQVESKFLDALNRVPSFGNVVVDRQIQQYIRGLANIPRCNECWSFEGGRYFGSKGLEVQKTRCIPLLPKAKSDHAL